MQAAKLSSSKTLGFTATNAGFTQLCYRCVLLNFEALRNPSASDLPSIREGHPDQNRHPFRDKRDDAHKRERLGTLEEIHRRATSCPLCALVERVVRRQYPWSSVPLSNTEHAIFYAETTFYGMYRDGAAKNYWIRRLSITIETSSVALSHKNVAFAIQACNLGATAVEVDASFADPRADVDVMVFGGRKRPLQLNIEWLRRWMRICDDHHGAACTKADVKLPEADTHTVRFIDVVARQVVAVSQKQLPTERYMALRYVWGHGQRLMLQTTNADQLMRLHGLPEAEMPLTIEDAILLARLLGFRHLWVDSLCIIQDSDADKTAQVAIMSYIYCMAYLTVVAAAEDNADGGLPGLRPGTRFTEQEEVQVVDDANLSDRPANSQGEVFPGFSLMTTLSPSAFPYEHFLEHTPWSERGWTMQERVMSRRVLAFTKEQVWWICRKGLFCEESYFETDLQWTRFHESSLEPTLTRDMRNFYEPEDRTLRFWKTYSNLVAAYTRRAFTYDGDVYDACLAILQGLSALSTEDFVWGIPRSHFEQGLFWEPFRMYQCHQRRTEVSTLPMTNLQVKVPFPSWSWMGWIGETSITIGNEQFDENIR